MRNVEVGVEALKGLLDTLMASCMDHQEHPLAQVMLIWTEDVLVVEELLVIHAPGAIDRPFLELMVDVDDLPICRQGHPDLIQEVEGQT